MSWITLDVDIDIDEFLSNCSKKDIKYIIECLVEDGHLDKKNIDIEKKKSVFNDEWENSLNKLKNNKHRITVEEEKVIQKISDRLI